SGKGAAILSAAYAQLGVHQDCTMLVTNALAAVGIHFHDWPAGYLSLGETVPMSQAQPGDLLYYADGGGGMAHIAVYAGNGMAVHGGFNGNDTVVFSANVGSGPVAIRVR
uniref:NlpC/P60 family protein n=1 Tax=Arthrobacter sp. TaxID=1667 RepID=UPI0025854554